MAIDIFQEGLHRYIDEERRKELKETANEFRGIADSLEETGTLPELQPTLDNVELGVKRAEELASAKALIDERVNALRSIFLHFGLSEPPAEILSMPRIQALSTKPEVTVEDPEKEKQIAWIKTNLGNPSAFNFDPEMTVDELFEEGLEAKKGKDRIPLSLAYFSLQRSQITTASQLLSMSYDEWLSLRNFGNKCGRVTLEILHQHGILPRENDTLPK